jgi:hypothetical protein
MRDRPARARIEYMPVSHPILLEVTARVAAGRERTVFQFQDQRGFSIRARPLDADLPWTARRRSVGAQIAAEVYETRSRPVRCREIVGAVDGVLLADTAEVQFHPSRKGQTG